MADLQQITGWLAHASPHRRLAADQPPGLYDLDAGKPGPHDTEGGSPWHQPVRPRTSRPLTSSLPRLPRYG